MKNCSELRSKGNDQHTNKKCLLKECCCKEMDDTTDVDCSNKFYQENCADINVQSQKVRTRPKSHQCRSKSPTVCNPKKPNEPRYYEILHGTDTCYKTKHKDTCDNLSTHVSNVLCQLCCCLVNSCKCNKKTDKMGSSRPRTLCEDLPLYDEKSHLLGYIKRGSVIDVPFCALSRDTCLELKSTTEDAKPQLTSETDPGCMPSCHYASDLRRQNNGHPSSRWTTTTAFNQAIKTVIPETIQRKEKHSVKKCSCCK